jgi:hypothetical protein
MSDELDFDGYDESPKEGRECRKCGKWVYPDESAMLEDTRYCDQCQPPLSFQDVWRTLSNVDVTDFTAKRGNYTYMSWSWAWGVLMDHFPQAEYKFDAPGHYEGGTVEVRCTISIGDLKRSMWLPVMDHTNKAVKNPDARKISDAKMRCLVKCIAMFGLGHYIYAGEDVPTTTLSKAKARDLEKSLREEMDKQDSVAALQAWGVDNKDAIDSLPEDWQNLLRTDYKESLKWLKDQEMNDTSA